MEHGDVRPRALDGEEVLHVAEGEDGLAVVGVELRQVLVEGRLRLASLQRSHHELVHSDGDRGRLNKEGLAVFLLLDQLEK